MRRVLHPARPWLVAGVIAASLGALALPALAAGDRARAAGKVTVVSPKSGRTSGSSVLMRIRTAGFRVTSQATRVRPNEGHFHVFLDKRPFVAVYGKRFRFRGLKPGAHRLQVVPVNSAHMPAKGYRAIVVKFTAK